MSVLPVSQAELGRLPSVFPISPATVCPWLSEVGGPGLALEESPAEGV